MGRWVRINGRWTHIVFEKDETYINGVSVDYAKNGEQYKGNASDTIIVQ